MIFDGAKELRAKQEEELKQKNFSYPAVLLQGVATSIDALFVGFGLNAMITNAIPEITLGALQGWAWLSVLIIGVTTFIISLTGVLIGVKVGKLFKKKASVAEIIGGVVLMLIAVKLVLSGCGVIPF